MTGKKARTIHSFLLAVALLLPASMLYAIQPPQGDAVSARARAAADSYIPNSHQPLSRLPLDRALQLEPQLSALGVPAEAGFYDPRAGRWGTLLLAQPLVPGAGVGNALTWSALGRSAPANDQAYKDAVAQAFTSWLNANQSVLGVNTAELGPLSVGSYENRRLVHIYADRVVNGVPVRSTFVTATLNNGNLVLYGTQNWGAVTASTTPSVTADQARAVVASHLSGFTIASWGKPELVLVPFADGGGLGHRLAWAIGVRVRASNGSWEALVDANDRELLAFQDRNEYFDAKKVVGGVFPVSNDGQSPNGIPDGVEQPEYPMSRAYVYDANGNQIAANSEGLVNVTTPFSMRMDGPFLRISDTCGAMNQSTNCMSLNLGAGPGTDCAVPNAASSPGNTHSGRTGFYEVNRIIDQAKSWLGPASASHLWLNRQLPANMNINAACNAFFSFADQDSPATGSINFYRSSPDCRNTGEIAAVFDHEWGHGLDFFDDSPGVSVPGEAYADMAAIVRLNSSCIGRGFFQTGTCGGNGDPCTECSGVREADWKKRQSGKPHDLSWVLGQNPTVPGSCPGFPTGLGPCGRSTHCEGSIITEAFWDLLKRDMPCHGRRWESFAGGTVGGGRCTGGQATTIDENTVQLFGTRLFYLAAGGVKAGYQCDPALGGCVASSWYLQILAADDDDGSILNGTPHMVAVHDAFSRHGIACGIPLPMNFGCGATPPPATAPTVTASAGVRSATITWTPVPGAAAYWVMRTDGVHGCNMGKTRVAEIPAGSPLTFTQTDLLDGHQYFYSVAAVGGIPGVATAGSCAGPMSACASVTPTAPTTSTGASATVDSSSDPVILTGDGDPFVDNCEVAELSFNVNNTGGVPLTNVRVTSITPSSSGTEILTPLPLALADITSGCDMPGSASSGTFRFRAGGLASQSSLSFDVTVSTNELGPITGTLTVSGTETDLVMTNLTYDFENGMQGWTVASGTFNRITAPAAGAQGTSSYLKSSSFTDDACDSARSPKIRLTSTSTLSLYNQFLTEAGVEGELPYYDRANVGIVDESGQRTLVQPDGGRLYNADDPFTGCNNGNGWATSDSSPVNLFAVSNWSAAALGGGNFGVQEVQIDVTYGTDALFSVEGFQFDQVRITDVLVETADQQGDSCASLTDCYEDSASQIAYTSGWHAVSDPDASGGSFRVHLGNAGSHNMSLPFTVSEYSGATLTYRYATSPKGGTADVYIDGVYRETVSYAGPTGATKSPDFSVPARTYGGLTAGSHTFELRNMSGAVYVDRICVPSGATGATPSASPGATSSRQSNVGAGQESQSLVSVPVGAMTISVAAVSEGNTPLRVVVVNPLGVSVGVAEASNGIAAVDVPVSLTGVYIVKVVNLDVTDANVWTVATPLVQH